MEDLRLALAQVSSTVGDFEGNSRKVAQYAAEAERLGAQVVVFPELCLTGYPPEDLLLKSEFVEASMRAASDLADAIGDIIAVVGFVESDYDTFNSAAVMSRGRLLFTYRKTFLPNYGVFDEKRYFGAGDRNVVMDAGCCRVGITICEDIWYTGGPVEEQVSRGGAEVILNLSASPFNRGKYGLRKKLIEARALDGPAVVAYVNCVGAQDELVFDGGSCVYHPDSGFIATAGRFEEELLTCSLGLQALKGRRRLEPRFRYGAEERSRPVEMHGVELRRAGEKGTGAVEAPPAAAELSDEEEILQALTSGLAEYVWGNGFEKAVLGLSGGIDSAVTAAVASRALGSENVICLFLPSRYTSSESDEAARELAGNLGVRLLEVPIGGVYEAYERALEPLIGGAGGDAAYENIQARIRGNLLMAFSNRFGWLVLATGNKSELSMGYCTLYGDMAGGFALLKDLFKTEVYRLAEFINESAGRELIPRLIIERAPSAELAPGQLDTDALPPYEELDPVLEAYIEGDLSPGEIVSQGFDPGLVRAIIAKVDSNEYKRRQAPVGVKVTPRAFGRDWRMPISAGGRPRG